jgi:dihydroxy-acid dehydratase
MLQALRPPAQLENRSRRSAGRGLNLHREARDHKSAGRKLVKAGVGDMVRISDARMSGTSHGACILHVSPEAYIGGPLALVRTGDIISLDVAERALSLHVSNEELAQRRSTFKAPEPRYERGYGWMFSQHIRQAHEGCDFDFPETSFGRTAGEPVIY